MSKSCAKVLFISACQFLSTNLCAQQVVGIIGGGDFNGAGPAFAAFVSSDGTPIFLPVSGDPLPDGEIYSVAINNSGNALIGGSDYNNTNHIYAAYVTASGNVTQLIGSFQGAVNSVAVNDSNAGLIGGITYMPIAGYAAQYSGGILTDLALPSIFSINSVTINASGNGAIAGAFPSLAYAALVSSTGSVSALSGAAAPANSVANSIAITDLGNGIVGGKVFSGAAYAGIFDSMGVLTLLPNMGGSGNLPNAMYSSIDSVAINNSGEALIGGSDGNFTGYAALVSPLGVVTNLSTPGGIIQSVAINESGNGIIGGTNEYVAFVSPTGSLDPITLPFSTSSITSVAIDALGNGLVGGQNDTSGAFAALISSSKKVVSIISLPSSGIVDSVSLLKFLTPIVSSIPTNGITGNNLSLANYINNFAPDRAIYFTPAYLNGTLALALETTAPTRNAFTTFASQITGSNMCQLLAQQLWDNRFTNGASAGGPFVLNELPEKGGLTASNRDEFLANAKVAAESEHECCTRCCPKSYPYTLWVMPFGEYATEKAQKQSPAFSFGSGVALLGLTFNFDNANAVGFTGAYVRTHIHEDDSQGHANTNLGYFGVYGTAAWSNWYLDAMVWGGYYSASNVRHIHFIGVDEKAKAHIQGWQLIPHFELGYDIAFADRCGVDWFGIDPFLMIDWVSNWQEAFHEHGASLFNMGQKGAYSSFVRGETGLRFYEAVMFGWGKLIFLEKASYSYQKAFKTGSTTAFLVGSPGTFTVTTLTTAQNLGVGEFSMLFIPKGRIPYFNLRYQGEFGSMYQSHQGSLEIGMNF